MRGSVQLLSEAPFCPSPAGATSDRLVRHPQCAYARPVRRFLVRAREGCGERSGARRMAPRSAAVIAAGQGGRGVGEGAEERKRVAHPPEAAGEAQRLAWLTRAVL